MVFDVNAWVGTWPFRMLTDSTPAGVVARMDEAGIQQAAVSLIEAIFHRNVQPANERLADLIAPYRSRLTPWPPSTRPMKSGGRPPGLP